MDSKAEKKKDAKKSQAPCLGRKAEFATIHRSVFSDKWMVLSVWGIPGVGKSHLVECVCSKLRDVWFQNFGWVNITHPFDLRELSRKLLLDLYSGSLRRSSMVGIKDPIQECQELLQEYKCLIVLDGLHSKDEWDLIRGAFPIEDTKCKFIVITNKECVATCCATSRETVLNVKGLEAHDALLLFKMKIGRNLSPQLSEPAKLMLQKCGGLPKLIVSIASYFRDHGLEMGPDSFRWRRLSDQFVQELEGNGEFGGLQGLLAWMHSYFHTCPDFLKPCVFYLSIFPANYFIRRRRLLRRWIAEGYTRDTEEGSAEETAEKYFCQLVKLSMIQQQPELVDPLCQVNGFLREYVMSRPMEENLVFELDGHCRKNLKRTGRHLTIQRGWDKDRNVFKSIDFSRLRSLTVFGEWESFLVSKNMRLLRVLDLEGTLGVKDSDVEEMVKRLPRLRFFSLRGCQDVKRLPDPSLGILTQLQTLDIRGTSIVMLPKSIIKLQKLQYVRAGKSPSLTTRAKSCWSKFSLVHRLLDGSHNGVKVPRQIFGRLSDLHTLGVVNISATCCCEATLLRKLKKLSQLHKLEVSGVNRRNSRKLFSAISDLPHLESLSLQLDRGNQVGCFDDTSPPGKNLRSLKLYGLVGTVPGWITQLRNLKKLSLQMTMLIGGEISRLRDRLEPLHILRLSLTDGEISFDKSTIMRCLTLDIICTSKSTGVRFSERLESSIAVLKISCCDVKSSLQFSGLENLDRLKEVWLCGTYEHEVRQHLDDKLANHPSRVKPVLRLEEPRS